MYGVYINCSQYLFIDWIITGAKRYETRTRDVLKSLIGQRVALIETGRGEPTIRATVVIKAARTVPRAFRDLRTAACIINTPYDIKPGQSKVFYELTDAQPVEAYKLPADHINHGRSYTEF